ncbi:MAG: DUF11 domain-containing protein [Micrococcales bacterium]|nr:DUF11 domain-containing protein [Micrococcales bacterium]MCL2667558.1 DUF11 domain-containing protein [Micrococcales bacterium]
MRLSRLVRTANKATPLVAVSAVLALLLTASVRTGTTMALWTQDLTHPLGDATLLLGSPADQSTFDLAVTMHGSHTVVPTSATSVDYTVSVFNHGPDPAENITVEFQVPLVGGLLELGSATPEDANDRCDTDQAGTPQPGTPDHGLVVCTIDGPVAVNGAYQIAFVMDTQQALPVTTVTATATVSAPQEDPSRLANNTASWTMSTPHQLIDLSLLKTGPASIEAGKIGAYTLTVKNETVGSETSVAAAPVVVDSLPPGVTFLVSKSPSWCTVVGDPSDGQEVTCNFAAPGAPGTIASGADSTIELSVQFDESLAGTTITNTATVSSTDPDPSLANNTWTATTVITEGSGNEEISRCDPGYVWGGIFLGCVLEGGGDGGGAVQLADPTRDTCSTDSPKPAAVTVNKGATSNVSYSPWLPESAIGQPVTISIAVPQAWTDRISSTAPWTDGTTLKIAVGPGKTWTVSTTGTVTASGKVITATNMGPVWTMTFTPQAAPSEIVNGYFKFDIQFSVTVNGTGGGNFPNVGLYYSYLALAFEYENAGDYYHYSGATPQPAFGQPPATDCTYVWAFNPNDPILTSIGYGDDQEGGPKPGSTAPAMAPLTLADSDLPPQQTPTPALSGLETGEDAEQAEEGVPEADDDLPETVQPRLPGRTTKDAFDGVFDPDAMTLTLEDGTVLVVVSVEEVDGSTVITTEDGTQFVSESSDDSTWVEIVAEK